jgi:hypothetical protein
MGGLVADQSLPRRREAGVEEIDNISRRRRVHPYHNRMPVTVAASLCAVKVWCLSDG